MNKLTYYLLAIVLFSSCDPAKRLQRNEARKQKIITQLMLEGICEGDTIIRIVHDTTIKVDTVGEIYIYTDTSYISDTVLIKQLREKKILKTITLTDTVIRTITDVAGMEAVKSELDRIKNECGGMKAQRNVAYSLLAFALSLAGIIIMVIIKPK